MRRRILLAGSNVITDVMAIYEKWSGDTYTNIGYDGSIGYMHRNFSAVEIDGVPQESFSTTYYFNELGEHTVKYTLVDPTVLGSQAFRSCNRLISIVIPDTVTVITGSAFQECTYLEYVKLPEGLLDIGTQYWDTFYMCRSLKRVNSDIDGVVNIPLGVTVLPTYTFAFCDPITEVNMSENVTEFGYGVFNNDINLKRLNSSTDGVINLPSHLESIGNTCFLQCSQINYVNIPNTVTSIGDGCFSYSGLISITIPNSVTSFGVNQQQFTMCNNLTEVIFQQGSQITFLQCLFQGCPNLVSVTLPDSLVELGYSMFHGCTNLPSIMIPSTVTTIGLYCFYECNFLKRVNSNTDGECIISNGVTSIGNYAFYNCHSLVNVDIPSSVTSIGDWAFNGLNCTYNPEAEYEWDRWYCYGIHSVICRATTPPTLGSYVFNLEVDEYSGDVVGSIYVPSASVNAYKAASGWSEYEDRIFAIS